MHKKGKVFNTFASLFLTLAIVVGLFLAGPARAITVGFTQTEIDDYNYEYEAVIDIHSPDVVTLDLIIINVGDTVCAYDFDTQIYNDAYSTGDTDICETEIEITDFENLATYTASAGYGYGFGSDGTTEGVDSVSWASGYGYTASEGSDVYSATATDGEITITFTLDTSDSDLFTPDEDYDINIGVAGLDGSSIKFTYKSASASTISIPEEDENNGGSNDNDETPSDPSHTYSFFALPAGTRSITVSNLPVYEMDITTNIQLSNAGFTFSTTTTPPAPLSDTYQYLKIDHPSVPDNAIDGAKIFFKVAKTWLIQNGLNKEDMTLYRYNNGWNALTSNIEREDANFVYYSANSPGLSVFAIGKRPIVAIEPTTQQEQQTEPVVSETLAPIVDVEPEQLEEGTSGMAVTDSKTKVVPIVVVIITTIACITIILLVALHLKNKR